MRPVLPALTLLTLAAAAAMPSATTACSCLFLPDFPTAYAQSHTIFLGEVTGVETASPDHFEAVWVTFNVETGWKGDPPSTVRVLTGAHDGICGVGFVPGERYLVYALAGGPSLYGSLLPGDVWTHSCWRSHGYWPDDPDLALLGPTPVASRSWGSLKIRYR